MDSLKKPETILSIATATSLAGASIYFYKRTGALDEKIEKLENITKILVDKSMDIGAHGDALAQVKTILPNMTKDIAMLRDEVQRLQHSESQTQHTLDNIIGALSDNGIYVGRSQPTQRSRDYQPQRRVEPIHDPHVDRYNQPQPTQRYVEDPSVAQHRPTPYRDSAPVPAQVYRGEANIGQPSPYPIDRGSDTGHRTDPHISRPYSNQPAPYSNQPAPYSSQPGTQGHYNSGQPTPYLNDTNHQPLNNLSSMNNRGSSPDLLGL